MKTVYKYPFRIDDRVKMLLPSDAKILSVQCQREQACMWCLVDPDRAAITRSFRIFGTGHPISGPLDKLAFIGTFMMLNDALVFHMFEEV